MANWEEWKSLPTMSNFFPAKLCILPNGNPQNLVKTTNQNWVHKTETTRRACLAGKQDSWQKGLIEEVVVFFYLGNLNLNKPWIFLQNWTMKIPKEKNSNFLRMFLLILARTIAVTSGIAYAYFVTYDTKYKAVFTVLKLFYLFILAFNESLFLEIGNITEVHFQEWGKYF